MRQQPNIINKEQDHNNNYHHHHKNATVHEIKLRNKAGPNIWLNYVQINNTLEMTG
jgi:hypothetical protein